MLSLKPYQNLPQKLSAAKTFATALMVLLSLNACSTLVYTPEESAKKIVELESRLQTIEALWLEAEGDLKSCTSLLKDCQPLIRP